MALRRLTKSGIRQPWLPRPLLTAPENIPIEPIITIPAPHPSVFNGLTQWIGNPRFPEQARVFVQAVVIVGAMVLAPAQVWMPRPLDAGVVQPDRIQRPLITVGQQPIPQSQTLWLKAPDDEPSIQWPTVEQAVGPQPTPQAQITWLRALRDEVAPNTDRLAPTLIRTGQQPIPQAQAVWTKAPDDEPSIQWPVIEQVVNQPPTPQAQAVWLRTIRDEVAPTLERLVVTAVSVGQQIAPQPRFLLLARPSAEAPIQWPRILLSVGQQVSPTANAQLLKAIRDLGADHAWPLMPRMGQQPTPQAQAIWMMRRLDSSGYIALFTYGTISGPGSAGTLISPSTSGTIEG